MSGGKNGFSRGQNVYWMCGRAGTSRGSVDTASALVPLFGTHTSGLQIYKCCTILESWDLGHSISEEKMGYTVCVLQNSFFNENALSIHRTYQLPSLQTDQNPTLGQPTVEHSVFLNNVLVGAFSVIVKTSRRFV